MSINSGILDNYGSMQDKIIAYIEATKEYGKPSAEAMDYFWENFGEEIKSNQFRMDAVDRDIMDEKWFNITKCCMDTVFSGGYAWYRKIAEIDFTGKTDEEIAAILQNIYVVEEKVADSSLKSDAAKPVEEVKSEKPKYTREDLHANYIYRLLNGETSKVPEAEHSDKSEEALSSKEAEKAKEAEATQVAGGLTDDATNELFGKFMDSLMEEDSPVMGVLAAKTHEIQKAVEQKEKHTYKFNNSYGGNFTTADIYNDALLTKATEILNRTGRLLIIGETGSGKSELAYKLIAEITGEPIGVPTGSDAVANYNRVCIANARNGYSFWYEDDSHTTIGKLRLFVEHIRKSNITEPCVFVGNEIQSSDFGYLLGDALFDAFNNSDRVDEQLLPSNLYIIFIGCNNRNFGIDDQVYGRVEHVKLEYLSDGTSEGEVVADKIIKNIGKDNQKRSEEIVKLVSQINSIEKDTNFASVISTRELVRKLKGQKTALISKPEDKENLTSESKKLLDKLERL